MNLACEQDQNIVLVFGCQPSNGASVKGEIAKKVFQHLHKKVNENEGVISLPVDLLDFKQTHGPAETVNGLTGSSVTFTPSAKFKTANRNDLLAIADEDSESPCPRSHLDLYHTLPFAAAQEALHEFRRKPEFVVDLPQEDGSLYTGFVEDGRPQGSGTLSNCEGKISDQLVPYVPDFLRDIDTSLETLHYNKITAVFEKGTMLSGPVHVVLCSGGTFEGHLQDGEICGRSILKGHHFYCGESRLDALWERGKLKSISGEATAVYTVDENLRFELDGPRVKEGRFVLKKLKILNPKAKSERGEEKELSFTLTNCTDAVDGWTDKLPTGELEEFRFGDYTFEFKETSLGTVFIPELVKFVRAAGDY